ncbi:hypothetical protein NQZ68_020034 [Dissostichus eleginoides]|nr:hypothetical protein NQZ68_020034 [Dissostichus eleginoides]
MAAGNQPEWPERSASAALWVRTVLREDLGPLPLLRLRPQESRESKTSSEQPRRQDGFSRAISHFTALLKGYCSEDSVDNKEADMPRLEFTLQRAAAERPVVNHQRRKNNGASARAVWKKDESGSLSLSTACGHCSEPQERRGQWASRLSGANGGYDRPGPCIINTSIPGAQGPPRHPQPGAIDHYHNPVSTAKPAGTFPESSGSGVTISERAKAVTALLNVQEVVKYLQAFSGCKKPRWESTVLSSQQLQSAASFRRDWESNAAQSQKFVED